MFLLQHHIFDLHQSYLCTSFVFVEFHHYILDVLLHFRYHDMLKSISQCGGWREGGDVARPDGLGREVLRQARQARDVDEGAGAVRHAPRLSPPHGRGRRPRSPHPASAVTGRWPPVPRGRQSRSASTRLLRFFSCSGPYPAGSAIRISAVGRVGLLGRTRAGTCPNLLQRRSAVESAVRRSAEYQRFAPGVPARSGPLQQIWTTAPPGCGRWRGAGKSPAPLLHHYALPPLPYSRKGCSRGGGAQRVPLQRR